MIYKMGFKGVAELADYEDLMLTPYLDSGGVKTVGIGSTVSDIPDLKSWSWTKPISIQAAVDIYVKSLAKYEKAVNDALKVPIAQHQYDALVSFIYNCGIGAVNSSVFKRVNNKESNIRVGQALLMWVNDNGVRVKGLVNRRAAEAKVYATGVYKSNGCCDLIEVNKLNHKPNYGTSKRISLKPYVEGDEKELNPNTNWVDIVADYLGYTKKPS
jgi:lysozyme